jgi:aminoglycoside/choline kinase family phosphotransferase
MVNQEAIKNNLINLFEKCTGQKSESFYPLPESGSNRKYFLISSLSSKVIGAYNPDRKENVAFISMSRLFYKHNLKVPEILAENLDDNIYITEYLGDTTLYSYMTGIRKNNDFPDELINIYKKVIEALPGFQIKAGKEIDYKLCYPRGAFDRQSMMWDLNYFKYYFLRLAQIQFDEQQLEDDFNIFIEYLLKADCSHFLYRDFQSRNIMLKDEVPYFIDYQGGRRGALQYDIASLLYDAKADIPQHVREMLLEFYMKEISKFIKIDKNEFLKYYQGYSLIRIMQAMGAYGFRGFYEKKTHFLQSIPYAVMNIQHILGNMILPVKIPALLDVLNKISISESIKKISIQENELTVSINSFSYKNNIPIDESGNGGGFVFDCRAVRNPGREEQFKSLTGKDNPVKKFLNDDSEMSDFLKNVFALVDQSVKKYQSRGFANLMVNFGCTGGQHRSVYCAERLAEHLKNNFNVKVIVLHQQLEKLET